MLTLNEDGDYDKVIEDQHLMLIKTIENEQIEKSKAIILQKEKNKKKLPKSKFM